MFMITSYLENLLCNCSKVDEVKKRNFESELFNLDLHFKKQSILCLPLLILIAM